MSESEEAYYRFQTEARGLLDEQSLRRTFERSARWYESRLGPYLPADRNARWIDLPCGYGNFLFFLAGRGYRNVTGYDIDPEQIRLASILGLPAERGDAFDVLSDEGHSCDAIASVDFIEHLSKDDAFRFLRLCSARLQPGGVLVVRTPSADGPFGSHDVWNDVTHRWGMTSGVLVNLLRMTGFEKIKILDESPRPLGARGLARSVVFHVTRVITSTWVLALGLAPPAVWSYSMWAVARKPSPALASGT